MKVYLAVSSDYDGTSYKGLFSNEEDANKAIEDFKNGDILEFEVDEYKSRVSSGLKQFTIYTNFYVNSTEKEDIEWDSSEESDWFPYNEVIIHLLWNNNRSGRGTIWAKTKEEALEIYTNKRQEILSRADLPLTNYSERF